jgi:hypothetical protein
MPPSRAQIDKKELPQSGTPGSDLTLDVLKKVSGMGFAQKEVKESLP